MSRLPQTRRTLSGEIKRTREQAKRLGNASPFFETGMHPNGEGGLDSDNYVPGVSGWRLGETPEFNDLKLRGGIIGNAALANPVKPDVSTNFASGFSVSTTYAVKMTRTWDVPSGFNIAQITGTAKVCALNDTAAADYLYTRSRLSIVSNSATVYGYGHPQPASAGGFCINLGLGAAYLYGFSANDQIRIQVEARTEFGGWSAAAQNVAEWTGSISWYRGEPSV